MCLMLYLGSRKLLPLRQSEYLTIEPVSKVADAVRDHVRREYVYFVGSYSGCSCGLLMLTDLVLQGTLATDNDIAELQEELPHCCIATSLSD